MIDNIVGSKTEVTKAVDIPKAKTVDIKPEDKTSTIIDDDTMPLEIWERQNKTDYILDLFDVGERKDFLPTDIIEGYNGNDEFIKKRIKVEGYEPTTRSYNKVLDQLKKELDIDEDTDKEAVYDRIKGFVNAYKSLRNVKEIDFDKTIKKLRQGKTSAEIEEILMKTVEKYLI